MSDFKAKCARLPFRRGSTLGTYTSEGRYGKGRGKGRRRKATGREREEDMEGEIWPTQKCWHNAPLHVTGYWSVTVSVRILAAIA